MTSTKPTVLFDIDGVTLDWFRPLPAFVAQQGLGDAGVMQRFHDGVSAGMVNLDNLFGAGTLNAYHASVFGRTMPAMEDPATARTLNAIREHHRVIAVTAFSDQPAVIANRVANLETLFPDVFSEVHSVAAFSSKRAKLEELAARHNVVLFVDDNRHHVQEGLDVLGAGKVLWFRGDPAQREVPVASCWDAIQAQVERLHLTRDMPPAVPRRRRVF